MSRPVHFEIPSDNPEASIAFWSTAFGWTFTKWDGPMPYWMISTGEGPGIDGGMMQRMDPGQPVTNVIGVASADATAESVTAAGGQVVVPKMAIPGIGYLIYFTDPDGNIFGAMEPDESAA